MVLKAWPASNGDPVPGSGVGRLACLNPPAIDRPLTVVDLHAGDDGVVGLVNVHGLGDEELKVLCGGREGAGKERRGPKVRGGYFRRSLLLGL